MKHAAGNILLAMLLLLAVGAAGWVLGQPWQSWQTARAARHDARVLAQAKQALLAWASLHCTQPGAILANVVAGELPRPDTDAPGSSGFGSQNIAGAPRLGRLPWRTLDLPPLRDASGEYLWYALRSEYGDDDDLPPSPCLSLTVYRASGERLALPPDDCVIALLFAPGPALPGQDRSDPLRAAAYLDAGLAGGVPVNNAAAAGPFLLDPLPDGSTNDRVLAIRWQELKLPARSRPCIAP